MLLSSAMSNICVWNSLESKGHLVMLKKNEASRSTRSLTTLYYNSVCISVCVVFVRLYSCRDGTVPVSFHTGIPKAARQLKLLLRVPLDNCIF